MSETEGRVTFFLVKAGAAVDLRGASEGGACGGEGRVAFFLVKAGATVVFDLIMEGGVSGGGVSGGEGQVAFFLIKAGATVVFGGGESGKGTSGQFEQAMPRWHFDRQGTLFQRQEHCCPLQPVRQLQRPTWNSFLGLTILTASLRLSLGTDCHPFISISSST